jgi:hypothetical protein
MFIMPQLPTELESQRSQGTRPGFLELFLFYPFFEIIKSKSTIGQIPFDSA